MSILDTFPEKMADEITLQFYFSSNCSDPRSDPDRIRELLSQLENHEKISVTVLDTATLDDEDVRRGYDEAMKASMYNQYPIRGIYGTNSASGIYFGGIQPALLVYYDEQTRPTDVYPHRKQEGGREGIEEYLEKMIEEI